MVRRRARGAGQRSSVQPLNCCQACHLRVPPKLAAAWHTGLVIRPATACPSLSPPRATPHARPAHTQIPTANDIPVDFRVTLLRNAPCERTPMVHSSKAVGEPPFFLGERAESGCLRRRKHVNWLVERRRRLRQPEQIAYSDAVCVLPCVLPCLGCLVLRAKFAHACLVTQPPETSHHTPPRRRHLCVLRAQGGLLRCARRGWAGRLVPSGPARHPRAAAPGLRRQPHGALRAARHAPQDQLLSGADRGLAHVRHAKSAQLCGPTPERRAGRVCVISCRSHPLGSPWSGCAPYDAGSVPATDTAHDCTRIPVLPLAPQATA